MSARLLRRAIRNPSRLHKWLGEHTFQLGVYLLIPKPQHSITLLVEISLSQPILALLLRLGVLTAVEFNNQVLRDAAEIGKVGTNPVVPAEFDSVTALGSEVRPQLPLLVSRLRHEDGGLDRADFRRN